MSREDRRKNERMARILARRIKRAGGPDLLAGSNKREWIPKIGDKVLIKVGEIAQRNSFENMVDEYKQFISSLDENTPYVIESVGMNEQVFGIDAHPYFQIWKGDMKPYKEIE